MKKNNSGILGHLAPAAVKGALAAALAAGIGGGIASAQSAGANAPSLTIVEKMPRPPANVAIDTNTATASFEVKGSPVEISAPMAFGPTNITLYSATTLEPLFSMNLGSSAAADPNSYAVVTFIPPRDSKNPKSLYVAKVGFEQAPLPQVQEALVLNNIPLNPKSTTIEVAFTPPPGMISCTPWMLQGDPQSPTGWQKKWKSLPSLSNDDASFSFSALPALDYGLLFVCEGFYGSGGNSGFFTAQACPFESPTGIPAVNVLTNWVQDANTAVAVFGMSPATNATYRVISEARRAPLGKWPAVWTSFKVPVNTAGWPVGGQPGDQVALMVQDGNIAGLGQPSPDNAIVTLPSWQSPNFAVSPSKIVRRGAAHNRLAGRMGAFGENGAASIQWARPGKLPPALTSPVEITYDFTK
jgi:hypothetical protein